MYQHFIRLVIPAFLLAGCAGEQFASQAANSGSQPEPPKLKPTGGLAQTFTINKLHPHFGDDYTIQSSTELRNDELLAQVSKALIEASLREPTGKCFIPRHQVVIPEGFETAGTWTICFECDLMRRDERGSTSAAPFSIQELLDHALQN